MRQGRGSNRSSATANVTLYCTWCPSGLTIGLHGQGSVLPVSTFNITLVHNGPSCRPNKSMSSNLVKPDALVQLFIPHSELRTVLCQFAPGAGDHGVPRIVSAPTLLHLPRRRRRHEPQSASTFDSASFFFSVFPRPSVAHLSHPSPTRTLSDGRPFPSPAFLFPARRSRACVLHGPRFRFNASSARDVR